jgi:hypothetical protein
MAARRNVVDRAIPEETQTSWPQSRLVPLGCDRVAVARSCSGRCGACAREMLLRATAAAASGIAIGMLTSLQCAFAASTPISSPAVEIVEWRRHPLQIYFPRRVPASPHQYPHSSKYAMFFA